LKNSSRLLKQVLLLIQGVSSTVVIVNVVIVMAVMAIAGVIVVVIRRVVSVMIRCDSLICREYGDSISKSFGPENRGMNFKNIHPSNLIERR